MILAQQRKASSLTQNVMHIVILEKSLNQDVHASASNLLCAAAVAAAAAAAAADEEAVDGGWGVCLAFGAA